MVKALHSFLASLAWLLVLVFVTIFAQSFHPVEKVIVEENLYQA